MRALLVHAGLLIARPPPIDRSGPMRACSEALAESEWSALDTWLQSGSTSVKLQRAHAERTILSGEGRRLPFFDALSFAQLGTSEAVDAGLRRCGFLQPTVVQAAAFAPISAGEDVIIAYPPGSGKSLAFCLPLIDRLLQIDNTEGPTPDGFVRSVVLVPSPELAQQTVQLCRGLANRKLRITAATGGSKWQTQRERAAEGLELLVATFGRLQAHLRAGSFSLGDARHVVLDEADLLYKDERLRAEWDALRNQLPRGAAITLVTSTLPSDVARNAVEDLPGARLLRSPRLHTTRSCVEERLIDCSSLTTADVTEWDRNNNWGKRVDVLKAELQGEPFQRALVLCASVGVCKRLLHDLEPCCAAEQTLLLPLHSAITPDERAQVQAALPPPPYEESEVPNEQLAVERASPSAPLVFIATERAVRGIDLPALDIVCLFDFPRDADEYLRSVGKATRGERPPAKVTFLACGRQLAMAKAFMTKDARGEQIDLQHAH